MRGSFGSLQSRILSLYVLSLFLSPSPTGITFGQYTEELLAHKGGGPPLDAHEERKALNRHNVEGPDRARRRPPRPKLVVKDRGLHLKYTATQM